MRNWVYRRPTFRVFKPKIPLVRPGQKAPAIKRRRLFRRRRVVTHSKAAAVVAALTFTAQTRSLVFPRRVRFFQRPPSPQRAQTKIPLHRPFEGKQGPFQRMLKAVARMRRMMRQRLRWKPREIPPVIVPPEVIHAPTRGSIFSGGAVMASVFSPGSKRGRIGGDH